MPVTEFIKKIFIPRYNELTLYLFAISFLMLLVFYADFRQMLFAEFDSKPAMFQFLIIIFLPFTLFICIAHAFVDLPKVKFEKTLMLIFAVSVSAATGIAAGKFALNSTSGFLALFPVWNIANGVLLLLMFRFDIIDTGSIVGDDATRMQVVVASFVAIGLFVVCRFEFNVFWAEAFSISVVYATNFDRLVQSFGASMVRKFEV